MPSTNSVSRTAPGAENYGTFGSGGSSAAYAFLKTNTAPRIYVRGGNGAAANAVAWINGQTNTTGFVTSHIVLTAEAPFTGVRLTFGNNDGVSYPISGASVAVGATLTDQTNSTDASRGNFVSVTFGGLATATVPAASGGNAGMLRSDLIPLASITRAAGDAAIWSVAGGKIADCYTLPLLHARVAQPITSASTPLLGQAVYGGASGATDAPYNTNNPTITGRFTGVKHASDATVQTAVGTTSVLTGTVAPAGANTTLQGILNMPIIGVEFVYAVPAMSVAFAGDSETAGAGVIRDGAGANSPAVGTVRSWARVCTETVSTPSRPIEFCYLALAGQSSTIYEAYFENLVNNGVIPTHAVYSFFSPNDGAAGPGATTMTNFTNFLSKCGTQNIFPATWTGMPVGLLAPQKLTNAGELLRLSTNASMRAGTLANNAKGQPVAWFEFDWYIAGGQKLSDDATPTASFNNSPTVIGDLSATLNLHPCYLGDKSWCRASAAAAISTFGNAYFA